MRHDLLALGIAIASLAFTASGWADPHAETGAPSCVTQQVRSVAPDGRVLTRRVRVCG